MIKSFIQGRAVSNRYVAVGFIGSFILGVLNINYGMGNLYGASSSDHDLLWSIFNKGALLLVVSLTFSLVLYRAIWLYKRRTGSFSFTLNTLACAHFLLFTLLSSLVIGANVYRAADGLLTKEHIPLIGTLDD
jgi:cytochrome bd-type quinol oxidase subunit 2